MNNSVNRTTVKWLATTSADAHTYISYLTDDKNYVIHILSSNESLTLVTPDKPNDWIPRKHNKPFRCGLCEERFIELYGTQYYLVIHNDDVATTAVKFGVACAVCALALERNDELVSGSLQSLATLTPDNIADIEAQYVWKNKSFPELLRATAIVKEQDI